MKMPSFYPYDFSIAESILLHRLFNVPLCSTLKKKHSSRKSGSGANSDSPSLHALPQQQQQLLPLSSQEGLPTRPASHPAERITSSQRWLSVWPAAEPGPNKAKVLTRRGGKERGQAVWPGNGRERARERQRARGRGTVPKVERLGPETDAGG